MMAITPSELGDRIRRKRQALGMSQRAMAERIGMARAHLTRLEGGKLSPHFDTLVRIADALGVDLTFLVRSPRRPAA